MFKFFLSAAPLSKDYKPDRASPSSKLSNNSNNNKTATSHSNNNNINSNRKDSFGSRDSLNESGIRTGSVAAHRKSLESKSVDPIIAVPTTTTDKPPRKSFDLRGGGSGSDIRKSLESLDDKPPVLSKKPTVPVKKSPIAGVTSNLLSGLKSKVSQSKNDSKSGSVQDNLDGCGVSKMQVADAGEKGIHGERIVVGRNESDFDQVERNTGVLKDMRANRAKLPKGRRPPTQANSSSTDLPNLLNGSTGSIDESMASMPVVGSMPPSNAMTASSHSEDELVKPKPREWEKNRAPWMAELKGIQAKKTSPNSLDLLSKSPPDSKKDDNHHISGFPSIPPVSTAISSSETATHERYDMSKSFSSSFVSSSTTTTSSATNMSEILVS